MPQPQDIIPGNLQACVALYDNSGETPDELTFRSGDILSVVQQDSAGLEGWWVCSFRGKQGICPSNRLRLLTEAELNAIRERRRRSWNSQSNKVMAPQKYGDVFMYDMPQVHFGGEGSQSQYDVPLTAQALQEESYDVPKPVTGGSLTPSSSISSLTTDSNRSSLIQQDYDIPRSLRLQPTQEEETGVSYDVPRSGGEQPLDLDSALDWLGRLEAQITSASSRLLGCAGPHWRSPQKLEPRISELRSAVSSLTNGLRHLTLFIHPILLSQQDKSLGSKLRTLYENLVKGDVTVRQTSSTLDALGWTVTNLAVENEASHVPDALDRLVSAAAVLTDDIRHIASFIQGNSTLLFKKNTPVSGNGNDNFAYMNIEKKDVPNDFDEKEEQTSASPILQPQANPHDRKILDTYSGHLWATCGNLIAAIDNFLLTVTENQPPKAFLSQAKVVISSAHVLVSMGDIIHRNLTESRLKAEVGLATDSIHDATSNVVHKTKSAALHFPSVSAVQYMVDSVVDLSHKSKSLKQAILAY